MQPKPGDMLYTADGDELRIEAITGVQQPEDGDTSLAYIVRAEDGLRYEVIRDGDNWYGELYPEDMA